MRYFIIILLAFVLNSCTNDTPQARVAPPTQTEALSTYYWVYDDFAPMENDVCWYFYADNGVKNCNLKFLYDCDSLTVTDTLTLGIEPEIGNAFYVMDSIEMDSINTYHFLQGRETYKGVFNNNGVCDKYINSRVFAFAIEIKATDQFIFEFGDTLFINKK